MEPVSSILYSFCVVAISAVRDVVAARYRFQRVSRLSSSDASIVTVNVYATNAREANRLMSDYDD